MLVPKTPTRLYFVDYDEKRLSEARKHLTYIDKKVDYEIQSLKHSSWARERPDFHERLRELSAKRVKNLLFVDEAGEHYTYTGLGRRLAGLMRDELALPQFSYPEPKSMPWNEMPPYKPYPYQTEIKEKLVAVKHGCIEGATGLGKTFAATLLVKHFGLKTVVMAPTESIAKQILADFTKYFGKKHVGRYFGGKKEPRKRFVVAIAASLTRIEEGSPDWELFQSTQVFIADESHLTAAATLAKVCFGLLGNVPYRFHFSGTQIRQDGLELLLEGIIGERVFEMSVREGVDQGYLAKPEFMMIQTTSPDSYVPRDANECTRRHLYYNDNVNQIAAKIADSFADKGQSVLILIDELPQFTHLLKYLKHPAALAHGGVTKENKGKIPPEHHDSDPTALVEQFNAGLIPILVGTSCISTGTDTRRNQVTVNMVGGKSEVAVRQGPAGRSTRLCPEVGKTSCRVFDFSVENISTLKRHADERLAIYNDIYGPCKTVKL